MWAIWRQLDEVDAAVRFGKKSLDIWLIVIGCVVPDDMNDALFGIRGLNLGKKLRGADPVCGGWLDNGCVEGRKVDRTMDIYATPACRSRDPGFKPVLIQPKVGFV